MSAHTNRSGQASNEDDVGRRHGTRQRHRVRSATRTSLVLFALGSIVAAVWVFTVEGAERVNRATIAAFVLPVFAAIGGAIREVFLSQEAEGPAQEPPVEASKTSADRPGQQPNAHPPLLHIKTQSAFGRSIEIEAFDAETVLIIARAMGWSIEQKGQDD